MNLYIWSDHESTEIIATGDDLREAQEAATNRIKAYYGCMSVSAPCDYLGKSCHLCVAKELHDLLKKDPQVYSEPVAIIIE